MMLKEVWFRPVGEFTFSDEEILVLMECSKHHYDGVCKEAGKFGGFLFGMNNRQTWDREEGKERSAHTLDADRLDTLAKIAEGGQYMRDPALGAVALMLNAVCRRMMKTLHGSTPSNVEVREDDPTAKGLRIGFLA